MGGMAPSQASFHDSPALRFGVIGAARIAPNALVKPARALDGVEVRAVAARTRDRAQAFAQEHAIATAYGDYAALLDDPAIDAVYIALPNALHAEWSIRALEAGKHVLCEKPLASNAEEARQIRAAAQASGKQFAEAFHNLYHPLLLRVRDMVRGGELGEIRQVRGAFHTTILRRQDIRFSYALGGGAMMDLGCYLVSLTRFVLDAGKAGAGEPHVVTAHAELLAPEVDAEMETLLRLEDAEGAEIAVQLSCAMRRWRVPRVSFSVVGTEGQVDVINPVLPQIWHRLRIRTAAGEQNVTLPRTSTYWHQLEVFVQSVQTSTPLPTDAEQGVRNMAVIDSVYRAAGMQSRGQTATGA